MKRLVLVGLFVLIAAVGLGAMARQGIFPEARRSEAQAVAPETTVVLLWCHEALNPSRLRIPKGTRVHFVVETTAETSPGSLHVPGYEALLPPLAITPGERREQVFETVYPGENFELRIGTRVVGRLDVTGEHVGEDRL